MGKLGLASALGFQIAMQSSHQGIGARGWFHKSDECYGNNVLLKCVSVKLTRATKAMGWMKQTRRMFSGRTRKKRTTGAHRAQGYGLGGEISKINGVEHAGAVAEENNALSPEENLVWAMLKLAAHDCLMFRWRGYIDEEGRAKLLKANLNGFEQDRLAPAKIVRFWSESAQEWMDALGGRLDTKRALNAMLRHPYRGLLNLGGH